MNPESSVNKKKSNQVTNMAGDKICAKSDNIENNEKAQDIVDCHLNPNTTDEAFSECIDYVPCPEFQFTTVACYICNGYYGPCFGEPVCATCHAFLFPDDIGLRQVPIFSEKTDDEDSGNDEPADLYYNAERRVSQQPQPQQQQQQQQQPQEQQQRNVVPLPTVSIKDYKSVASNISIAQNENSPTSSSGKVYSWRKNDNPLSESGSSSSNPSSSSSGNNINNNNNNNNNDEPSSSRQKVPNDNADAPELRNTRKDESPSLDEDLSNRIANNERIRAEIKINNDRMDMKFGECSRRENLADRVDMLTNYRHVEHQEMINEPGLVERLPPEVLLAVFSHLDDVSLWSAAKVCRRWYGLLLAHVPSQQWQRHVKIHWPLYRPIAKIDVYWFKVYDRLASSAPCRICFSLMCLRAEPSRMEENSWRKNRLRSELKSLKIDPPEGIEATPLDRMCCHWQATITGPIGSPYEGGLFYLYLQVPYSYPMCPPIVKFLTKILHPNVSRHGDVGIDSIHHNWSLALTISKVLISVQSLLTDPYCQVCMEPEIGEMYTNDRDRFEEIARSWTWKYAMHDILTPSS